MVSNLIRRTRQRLRVLAWYRRARKKHTVRFRIGGVCEFLRALEDEQIRAVVLRQPESVPRDAVAESDFDEDVDLLIDGQQLTRAVEIAAAFPGPIKCDPYTNTGHRGTTYRRTRRGQQALPIAKPHWQSDVSYHLSYSSTSDKGKMDSARRRTTDITLSQRGMGGSYWLEIKLALSDEIPNYGRREKYPLWLA